MDPAHGIRGDAGNFDCLQTPKKPDNIPAVPCQSARGACSPQSMPEIRHYVIDHPLFQLRFCCPGNGNGRAETIGLGECRTCCQRPWINSPRNHWLSLPVIFIAKQQDPDFWSATPREPQPRPAITSRMSAPFFAGSTFVRHRRIRFCDAASQSLSANLWGRRVWLSQIADLSVCLGTIAIIAGLLLLAGLASFANPPNP